MINLKGKNIVVTGGNGLLGSEILNEVLKAGGNAICVDIQESSEPKDNIDEFVCDLTKLEEVETLISNLTNKYKDIHGWVNNAYPRTQDWGNKLEKIKYASWQKNVDMHLNSYFLSCQKILEIMKDAQVGSVINMGSIYGINGPDFTVYDGTEMTMPAAYSAIKGGITNLTKYLASYYGKHNVRINTISPGGIFDNQPSIFVDNYNKKCPAGRMGERHEVAQAAVYLLSDYSSYVNGHNLVVDGGWSVI